MEEKTSTFSFKISEKLSKEAGFIAKKAGLTKSFLCRKGLEYMIEETGKALDEGAFMINNHVQQIIGLKTRIDDLERALENIIVLSNVYIIEFDGFVECEEFHASMNSIIKVAEKELSYDSIKKKFIGG